MMNRLLTSKFGRLVFKELRAQSLGIEIALGLIIVSNILSMVFWNELIGDDGEADAPALGAVVSFLAIFFWTLWAGIRSLSNEWVHNTHYLLLSLPVSGAKVLGAKLAAVLTGLTLLTAVSFGFMFGMLACAEGTEVSGSWLLIILDIILVGIYYLASTTIIIIIFQFAYILSRTLNRFTKVIVPLTVLSGCWLFLRGGWVLSKLFDLLQLPDVKIILSESTDGYLNPSPLLAGVLLAAGMFWVTAKLYDRVIEV